ncbi:MAG: hypothetical protein A3B74_00295 [Candidatus Kerfeldbacteria bacterium RIFCSPHIGHO2_02_FULL_42_14]|uniref:PDZ domain-containing protein n=1 Tax=Candidatus Kerfeldbacteria bacterium RIFCSPHIGHO2_02_FULL_42_14 TaxID=1798540 RepID=A0A1G2ARY2_9BACT|nr:MAG: hypothetical protein A3B74_00295 [Candidatus Kerfeldbacteria bacterium RIFCSPHIGHO2_02_FULL_42_14]OGY81284.1 MAG: hypothetical protein A3E60_02435 [Candidatus Kerfeldbacteria bacterium RIFCSPHIGHO2_12_FULL_42_13]OGY83559.1 MAG: hypothetical protein A3I91_02870 [Candidatus Kerfeldbacteria bacterium RIFCSPLOWO2_02_FULL_42_19]
MHKYFSIPIFRSLFVLLLICTSFLAGAVGGAWVVLLYQTQGQNIATPKISQKLTQKLVEEESGAIAVAKSVTPSVVSIVISKELESIVQRGPFLFESEGSGEFRDVGGGTGFFVSKDGLILTNRHVVSDEEAQYSVVLSDGRRRSAEILSRDPLNDLAIVKIVPENSEKFQPLEIGDSSALQVGQTVLAVGNSLAEFQNSVTKGVISGLGREVVAGTFQDQELLRNLLQTDAAINPGNSGGPLVNIAGQVVGINTAIAGGAENIGFAIPINEAKKALDSFYEFGEIVRPMLGVRYIPVNKDVAEALELPVDYGALLRGDPLGGEPAVLSGSPADQVGLKDGDILLAIDGVTLDEEHMLSDLISEHAVGDTIRVRYMRNKEELEIDVTLSKFGS